MAKQAKALGAKLRIQQGEEEAQEEDEEGGERDEQRGWGASKRAYYGADLADLEVGAAGWLPGAGCRGGYAAKETAARLHLLRGLCRCVWLPLWSHPSPASPQAPLPTAPPP